MKENKRSRKSEKEIKDKAILELITRPSLTIKGNNGKILIDTEKNYPPEMIYGIIDRIKKL